MVLTLFEPPNGTGYFLLPYQHAAVELACLAVILLEALLKVNWMGFKALLKHPRTAIKLISLLLLAIEGLVVIFRHTSHLRVLRMLRPVFLVDTHYCSETRRFVNWCFVNQRVLIIVC